MISTLINQLKNISKLIKGQGLVEYLFIIILIAMAVMISLGLLGTELITFFTSITDFLASL